jgi:lipopolysaccharide transport system permease protein
VLKSLWKNRELIVMLVRREILTRYKGSLIGVMWSLITPMMMLAVYTFVFSVVFNARWGVDVPTGRAEFAVVLFAGLLIHAFFSECLIKAPTLILSNVNLVKKVVFPLEVLPMTTVGTALFNCGINVLVLLFAMLIFGMPLHWNVLLFPIVLLPLALLSLGVVWLISALGVYLRDIAQLTGLLSTVLLFLAPVFFPASALPAAYQPWLNVNPLTYLIELSRTLLIQGGSPDWLVWFVVVLGYGSFAKSGYWWFKRSQRGFADVI